MTTVLVNEEEVDIGTEEVALDHGLHVEVFFVLHSEVLIIEDLVLILVILCLLELYGIRGISHLDKVSQIQLIIH